MKKLLSLLLFLAFVLVGCNNQNNTYNEKVDESPQFQYNKDGVDDFYNLLKEKDSDLSPLLKQEKLYNVTTENLKVLGVSIYKFADEGTSFLQYENEIFNLGASWGGYGFINAVTCDFDNNGVGDILYTYSWGSGLHRSEVAVLNLTTFETTILFSTFQDDFFTTQQQIQADLVLEKNIIEDKVVYSAVVCHPFAFSKDANFIATGYVKNDLIEPKIINFDNYKDNESYSSKVEDTSSTPVEQLEFSIEAWKDATREERGRMINDFIGKYYINSLTDEQVLEYLGTPDKEEKITLETYPPLYGGAIYTYYFDEQSLTGIEITIGDNHKVSYYGLF